MIIICMASWEHGKTGPQRNLVMVNDQVVLVISCLEKFRKLTCTASDNCCQHYAVLHGVISLRDGILPKNLCISLQI